jgi:Ca-activated chloride channel family protein
MSRPSFRGVRASRAATPAAWGVGPLTRFCLSLLVVAAAFVTGIGRPLADGAATVRLSEVESGSLLIKTDTPGEYRKAPAVKTHIAMEISGLIARVTVSQSFTNPSKDWAEGVYVFPLPENAAVDRLRLRIGDRFIEGRIKERAEARKLYEAALRDGRKASLVEQERPNIFTNSVANIGPGETVLVQIVYQQTLRYSEGEFSLRFPMVVGPRYIPSGEKVVAFNGKGWGADTRAVPDASRITPPVLNPKNGKVNPVSLEVKLDAGFPLAWVKSPTHKIKVEDLEGGTKRITFDKAATFAEKDLVLRWLPKTGTAPGAGLFTQVIDGKTYALLMVMPPHFKAPNTPRLPREAVFVIDTSGSMSGTSIKQAKAALLLALDRLKPADRFNIIEFNSQARALFTHARAADGGTVAQAKTFVRSLKARGGTEMLKALNLALDGRSDERRLRQVIFLTDGSVGNEAQLFRFIKRELGDSRLFTVGIGSAPNSYFMTKAAQYGRGTFTYISKIAEVKEKVAALYRKIEEPVLTNIRVRFDASAKAEMWPRKIPDLYRGEPVVVAVRLDKLAGEVAIDGTFAGKPWHLALPVAQGRTGTGVGALWARAKIAALMDSLHEGADRKEVRSAVIQVALAHHLVSKFTSLVAVDVTPSRPKGEAVVSRNVPVNLPEGWDFKKVFGPQTRQRSGERDMRRAEAPVSPGDFAAERKEREAAAKYARRSGGGMRMTAQVRRYGVLAKPAPTTGGRLADASPRGAVTAEERRKAQLQTGTNAPGKPSEAKPTGAKPVTSKPDATAGGKDAKAPAQIAAVPVHVAGRDKPKTAQGRAAHASRDLLALIGLLILALFGPTLWLRRRPAA